MDTPIPPHTFGGGEQADVARPSTKSRAERRAPAVASQAERDWQRRYGKKPDRPLSKKDKLKLRSEAAARNRERRIARETDENSEWGKKRREAGVKAVDTVRVVQSLEEAPPRIQDLFVKVQQLPPTLREVFEMQLSTIEGGTAEGFELFRAYKRAIEWGAKQLEDPEDMTDYREDLLKGQVYNMGMFERRVVTGVCDALIEGLG